jgi:hypothetical protein
LSASAAAVPDKMAIDAINSAIVRIILPLSHVVLLNRSGRDVRTPYGWLKGQQHCRNRAGSDPQPRAQPDQLTLG